ncbi:hypothetical protein SK128_015023 [Halocaridina rubra]|uniref:Uncharacterized protein n=1 Tax=Halocaridina rubra TaxID=373956 RepID=A0AAN8WIT1_HALRR
MMIDQILLISLLLASSTFGEEENRTNWHENYEINNLATTLPPHSEKPSTESPFTTISDSTSASKDPQPTQVLYPDVTDTIQASGTPLGKMVLNESISNSSVNQNPFTETFPNGSFTNEVPTLLPSTQAPTILPTTQAPTVKNLVTFIVRDSEAVCSNIHDIDQYETIVLSSIPPRKSLEYKTQYNAYSEPYNKTLEIIKAHMAVWRKGDSIVTRLWSIYELARNFELEFDRKLLVYKDEVKLIPLQSERAIIALSGDIERLFDAIEGYQIELSTVDEEIKPFLQGKILKYQTKLAMKKEQLQKSTHLGMKLEELKTFLGFVRRDSTKIKEKASDSWPMLANLARHIKDDNYTIHEFIVNVTNDMSSLEDMEEEFRRNLDEKHIRIQELRAQKERLHTERARIDIAIAYNTKRKKEAFSRLQKEVEFFEKQKKIICSGITQSNVSIPSACNSTRYKYLMLTYDAEVRKLNEISEIISKAKQILVESNTNLIQQLHEINSLISNEENGVSQIEKRINEIQAELQDFNMYLSDMESLIEGMDSAYPLIKRRLHGLKQVEDTFELITQKLDGIISQGNKNYIEEERENILSFLENDLTTLQESLDGTSNNMTNVEICALNLS